MNRIYCKNCYHSVHGSTDMDRCSYAGCGCKSYIHWSREDSQREENAKIDECESRLAKEHGLENHPKRDKLWSMAWEYGHSSGFYEVEQWYNELAELLK